MVEIALTGWKCGEYDCVRFAGHRAAMRRAPVMIITRHAGAWRLLKSDYVVENERAVLK